MKVAAAVAFLALAALAADNKAFPGQAGNDNIELTGTLIIDPAEIRQVVGADLGPGMVVARVKASNKTGEPMRIGPDDFVLISRKDGDRGDSLAPGQLGGGSALIVKRDQTGRDYGQQTNERGFTGVGGMTKAEKPLDEALIEKLKSKQMPDQETKPNASVEGLIYFSMASSKLKSKDVSLMYKGPGGRLTMEFK